MPILAKSAVMGKSSHHRAFRIFCWIVGAGGVTLLLLLSDASIPQLWSSLLIFVPLALLADSFSFQFSKGVYVSFGATIYMVALLLQGPVTAAWVAGLSCALSELLILRRGPHLAARSAGMHILMWLAGGTAYQMVGGTFPLPQLGVIDLLRTLLMFLVASLINRLVMVVDQLLRGLSPWEYLTRVTPRSLLFQIALVPMVAVIAATYTTLGLIPFVVLLGVLLFPLSVARRLRQTSAILEQRVTALDILNRVGRLLGASLQSDTLLEIIYEGASQLINTDNFWIVLYDREREELVYEILYDEGERFPPLRRPFQPGVGLAAYLIEQQTPLLAHNLEEIRELPIQLTTVGTGQMTESVLGVPMMVKGKVLGGIAAQSYQQDAFDQEDLETLLTLANQAAITLENAQLFREVEQGRRNLRAVLDSVEHAVVVTDLDGNVRLTNRAMDGLFGVSETEAIHRPLKDVVGHEALVAVAERIAAGRVTGPEELHVELSDGRALVAHLAPVTDLEGERTGYVVAMADISALHELSQLKSFLIRLASHDLRTPLHLAGGFFEMLVEDMSSLTEEQRDMAQRVRKNLEGMRKLIDELLELERVEERRIEEWELLDIGQLLQDVLREHRLQVELKRQQLRSDIAEDLPPVRGDARLLTQAVTNLVDNGIKYTPEKGKITVCAQKKAREIWITVQDNGVGIPLEDQAHIFEQFYRAQQPGTEQVSGTGLGLSLVQEIVKKHGGRVWVESNGIPGAGSTFIITLPIA